MKRKLFYCLLVLGLAFSTKAQTWSPVGSGISGSAANTTWSLYAYDSLLYAGGWFENAGGVNVNNMAQWNGTSWGPTGIGSSGYISAMATYKGNVYVGGLFDTMGGVVAHNIAMWNGSSWAPVGSGIKTVQYGPYAMAVYNGDLYVGGSFDSAGGKLIDGIAKWDGTSWSTLGTGIVYTDEESGVFTMTVYKGELYFGGEFVFSGGTNIAKWNGTTLSTVGGGAVGPIYSLAVNGGDLYAGGFFTEAGAITVNNIAMWDGTNWYALDSGITGEAGWASVNTMASYNGELYIGGYFDTVNGMSINCIAKWNGSVWSSVGTGIGVGGSLDAMAVYNNSLYVGGGFDSAGGVYAQNIAMWNIPNAVNNLADKPVNVQIFPNPVTSTLNINTTGFSNPGLYYSVYNCLGQLVMTGEFASRQNNNTIDVSSFASGLYLLSVISDNKSYACKFIKE